VIRPMEARDIERVGAIRLAASIQAHDFVPAEFWRSDHHVMLEEILPKATGFVHGSGKEIDGFLMVRDGAIGCLFVDPPSQRRGIGRTLLDHAKRLHETLTLTVYAENPGARRFYERQGFRATGEGTCPYTGRPEIAMRWSATA